jgi:hypothetical protein
VVWVLLADRVLLVSLGLICAERLAGVISVVTSLDACWDLIIILSEKFPSGISYIGCSNGYDYR